MLRFLGILVSILIVWVSVASYVSCVKEKKAVIQRIEDQIVEMEQREIDDISFRIVELYPYLAYANNIEDKKLMIEFIRKSKTTRRLMIFDTYQGGPKNVFIVDIGGIRIHLNDISLRLDIEQTAIPLGRLILSEEDSAKFKEFVYSLEEREWDDSMRRLK